MLESYRLPAVLVLFFQISQALLLISFSPFYDFQGVVIELLTDAMLRHPDSPGFLIDGFPRKLSQGEQFEEEASILFFNTYKHQQQRNHQAFFSSKSIPIARIHVYVTGLKITVGQNDHLSGQCSAGHFDRTRKQATRKKPSHTITFQENKHLFSLYVFAC